MLSWLGKACTSPRNNAGSSFVRQYLATSFWAAVYNVFFHPLASYPGPPLRAAFYFPDAISLLRGKAYRDTRNLHEKYGSVVRTSPNGLSYNTAQAWKDIYALKPDRTELAKDPDFYEPEPTANQSDHSRIRRLYAHAFTDTALLEQSPLLTRYFDLLVSKLKQKINGPEQGRVDLMAYYNFTTFDIIGDLTLGEPFGALESGEYHPWIRYYRLTDRIRDMMGAVKFLGVLRCAAIYPAVKTALAFLMIIMPSVNAKRVAHRAFARNKIEQRLDLKTDRKDFMTYASFSTINIPGGASAE
ncbi:MAG: hypothetical protein Q9207_002484 [Kuettlingeria erythrocarpa]